MNDRPKHHFARLIPFGLAWGAFTGGILHIWNHGLSLGPATLGYLATMVVIWGGAGILWAFLTSKFSKPKTNSGEDP